MLKPSIESGMHAEVYLTRPDVHAIIHTHQPYASALALIKMPIPALFDEQVRYLGRSVDIVPYAPSGTSFLSSNVRRQMKTGNNAFILQNHGVLVLGGDAERAIQNMALLEKCALTYLLALMTEKKVYKIPLPIREIAFAKLKADEKEFAKK
jgi:ribulose-5-phosphate 4-epimerase/fuculose-1-phosphate aldolase